MEDYFDTANKFGRIWNSTGNLGRISNCLVENNGNRNACIFSSVLSDADMKKYNTGGEYSKTGVSYVDTSNKSELIYNYNFKNLTYEDESNYSNYKAEWDNIKKYFTTGNSEFIMQAGDMLRLAYTSNGHVMIYVGKTFNSNDTGLIHSTGTDGSYDKFSVRYESSISDFLDNKIKYLKDNKKDKERIISISVLRPINKYCNKTTCTNENITSNDEARVAFSGTRVEKYITKDGRSISSYNSVDADDSITYGLNLEDKRKKGYCSSYFNNYYLISTNIFYD